MNPVQALLALLVFPGLAYAVPMGWLMLGGERKLRARFQGRIGPPITQPFWDTVKLLAKWPAPRVPGRYAASHDSAAVGRRIRSGRTGPAAGLAREIADSPAT